MNLKDALAEAAKWFEEFDLTPTVTEIHTKPAMNPVFIQKDFGLLHTCRFCGFEVRPAIDPTCGDWAPETNPNNWSGCPRCYGVPHFRGCRCAPCIRDYGNP